MSYSEKEKELLPSFAGIGRSGAYAQLAPRFVELEIEAHPDLAALPVSALQIDNKGDVVWLAKGACDARQSD